MKRWERVWIVEYQARNGKWFPYDYEFYDYKKDAKEAIHFIKTHEGQDFPGTYRATVFVRKTYLS